MGKQILPPGTETFLSSKTGSQVESAMRSLYESVMLDTSLTDRLTNLGIDLGIPRPPAMFANDDLWRAAVKTLAFGRKHTRAAVVAFVELLLGPRVSQVTTLERTNFAKIKIGDQLNIPAGPNAGVYTVVEVLTHHLIFLAGTFSTAPDLAVTYSIRDTTSVYGDIVILSDGRHALVDTTVLFVNTHRDDYLTKLNANIPQFGNLIFDKNSPTTEQSFPYSYYDKYRTGFVKVQNELGLPINTRNRYTTIRSTTLSVTARSGTASLSLKDTTNMPPSAALVDQVQVGDRITILTSPPTAPLPITGISGTHELTVGGGGLPVPGSPTTAEFRYIITSAIPGTSLSGGRGHFFSKKGKIYSGTKLVDVTKDFNKEIKPYIEGSTEPFSLLLNRGESNEEVIEVLSWAGNSFQLVLDPKDTLGETSLLKFNHELGELVEVYVEVKSSTGTYFPLTVLGATVGTGGVGSTDLILIDLTATFVAANADGTAAASYGDEVELVTVPVGSLNAIGDRRTIITFTGATQVAVAPAFQDTMLGCTYRIRKLYKAVEDLTIVPTNADPFLYLNDTTIFPAANFSVILDRGTTQEEVLWISANNLTLNRLTLSNSDLGTPGSPAPYFSKTHNFGVVVEPAQVLIEACHWDIMETRATGEYTIAIDPDCVKIIKRSNWFLHERTPHHLVDASSGVTGGAAQVGVVLGEDVVGGIPTSDTYIPKAPLAVPLAAGDNSFHLSEEDFVRLIANKPDSNNMKSGNLIFRPVFIADGNAEEEKFATTLFGGSFGTLADGVNAGDTSFISDTVFFGGTQVKIGRWNARYPNQTEVITTVGPAVPIPTGIYAGKYTITAAVGFSFSHSPGESLTTYPNVQIMVHGTFANSFAVPAATFVHYTYTHPSYRHASALIKDPEAPMLTASGPYTAGDALARYASAPKQFHNGLVGSELYLKPVTGGVVAPLGERRRIGAVGGIGNNVLFMDHDAPFGAVVADNTEFDIRSFLQAGDISDGRTDISGNANSAFPDSLNLVNLNTYAGGHKSTFPGKYLFRTLGEDSKLVDQPTYEQTFLQADPASSPDEDAAYKFSGPRRLIVPPHLSYDVEAVPSGAPNQLRSLELLGLDDATGKYLEVIGPNDNRDYRKLKKITAHDILAGVITCDSNFLDSLATGQPPIQFRILGDPDLPALVPLANEFWVDYPEYFPDPVQGEFIVTLARGTNDVIELEVSAVNTLNPEYGKFTLGITTDITGTFPSGTLVEQKIKKVVLPSFSSASSGGFYLGFGYGGNKYDVSSIGLGAKSVLEDAEGDLFERFISGVHAAVEYEGEDSDRILRGMYKVVKDLRLSAGGAETLRVRCRVLSHTAAAPNTVITIADFNFLTQKYRSFIGASVLLSGTATTVSDIDPVANTITVPVLVTPAADSVMVLVAKNVPVDDKELQSPINDLLTIQGVTNDGLFSQLTEAAGGVASTTSNIKFVNNAPLPTSLIGRRLQRVTTGEVVAIVDVATSAGVVPDNNDSLLVAPPLGAIAGGDVFSILPSRDLFSPNNRDAVGGVFTGINHPNPINGVGDQFPAHHNGASREYGVVQEYVEYLNVSVNNEGDIIYTLQDPFYPKYDHGPGSKYIMGADVRSTEGHGNDYRPYLSSESFSLLFGNAMSTLNSLFRAAGIESKAETTELGK